MNCEEHLILRVPDEWISSLSADTNIEFTPISVSGEEDGRIFKVRFGNIETLSAILDLPCILESHKTLDYINFFKNSDIAQMMYIIPEDEKIDFRARSN